MSFNVGGRKPPPTGWSESSQLDLCLGLFHPIFRGEAKLLLRRYHYGTAI